MKINKNFFCKLIILGQLLFYPIGASISQIFNLNSTFLSVLIRASILFSSILIILFFRNQNFKFGTLLIISISFWALYLIRLISYLTIDIVPLLWVNEPYNYLIWSIGVCFLPLCALAKSLHFTNSRLLFKTLSLLSFFAFFLIYPNLGSIVVGISGNVYDTGRLQSELLNPVTIGNLGNTLILPAYWGLLNFNLIFANHKKTIFRFILFINIIFGLILLLGSFSRGPILGCIVAIFVLEILHTKISSYSFLRKIIGFTTIFTIIFYRFSEFFRFDQLLDKFQSAVLLNDASSAGRSVFYKEAWDAIIFNPFLGTGLLTPESNVRVHNIVLESFLSGGILLGILMILIMIYALRNSILLIKNRNSFAWIGILFVPYLIQALLSGTIYTHGTFWAIIGSLSCLEEFTKENSDKYLNEDF